MPNLSVGKGLMPGYPEPRSNAQRRALGAIVAAAQDGRSFAALTGEQGTGKTAVLDLAAALLGRPPIQVIRVAAAGEALTSKRLIAGIVGAETDPAEAIEQALDRLLMPAAPCTRTILMIDDAHALERDALAYLQLISGLQPLDAASLQIVFAGRPQFWSLVDAVSLRRLRERIAIRAELEELLVGPREASPGEVTAAPDSALATLLAHGTPDGPMALHPPRRHATRYALGSGLAATVVMASMGPVARDAAHVQAPPITAGFAEQERPMSAGAARLAARSAAVGFSLASASSAEAAASPAASVSPPSAEYPSPARPTARSSPATAATDQKSPTAGADAAPSPAVPTTSPATPPNTAASPPPAQAGESTPSAPPVPPTQAAVPQPAATLPAALIASLLSHGDEMLRLGDIGAARLLYGRAAQAGSGAAAVAMGKTHDPRFLARIGAKGIAPDPAAAADWYRRAAALGDEDANRLLAGLGTMAGQ